MKHTTRDDKGRFCKKITKCINQFKDAGEPKGAGRICSKRAEKDCDNNTTFIDDTSKMPYIRGEVGDVFYVLIDSVKGAMRTYKRFVVDGEKLKADKTYKLADLLCR